MPRSSVNAHKRQRALQATLARGEQIVIADAARLFDVTPMTIRRDLRALEKSGGIVRCYGGALPANRISFEFAFDERRRHRVEDKRRIGAAAAALVEAGMIVMLDTGTTTLEAARAIAARGITCTVVTSSLAIAGELWAHDTIELMLVGGRARRGSPDLVGPATIQTIEQLTSDIAFLGCDALDAERGAFADEMETARVAQAMAAHSKRPIILADAGKFGDHSGVRYMKPAQVREVLTTRGAPRPAVRALRRQGAEVTLV